MHRARSLVQMIWGQITRNVLTGFKAVMMRQKAVEFHASYLFVVATEIIEMMQSGELRAVWKLVSA